MVSITMYLLSTYNAIAMSLGSVTIPVKLPMLHGLKIHSKNVIIAA